MTAVTGGQSAGANAPTFTIHVPCYNYGRYLPQALDSLLNQTFEDWEAIVIDDASTDDTSCVMDRYDDPRIVQRRHEVNRGHIATYNEALFLARGELFVLLSADDRYHPTFLQRVVEAFDDHPEAGLVYTDYELIDQHGSVLPSGSALPHRASGLYDDLELILDRPYILGCDAVARTQTLRQLGGYDEQLPRTADTFLWRQIATTAPFAYVHEKLYQYRRHETAMTRQVSRAAVLEREHRRQLERIFDGPEVSDRVRSLRRRASASLYWHLAGGYAAAGSWPRALLRGARALSYEPTVWLRSGAHRRVRRGMSHRMGRETPEALSR